MRIGFTGTRRGMTDDQKRTFIVNLLALHAAEFHHGDCVGADDEAATIAHKLIPRPLIHCWPPEYSGYRAFNQHADVMHPAHDFHARNRLIVGATEILLAALPANGQRREGGTWYTVGYANRQKKPVRLIWPDGSMTEE